MSHPVVTPCYACPPTRSPRLTQRGYVCDGCRARLRAQLNDLPHLAAALALHELEPDTAPYRGGVDPAAELPAASITSKKADRVTGTKEKTTPINVNAVDLTAPARHATVADTYGDQVGYRSAATILDVWMLPARQHRGGPRDGRMPAPTVHDLVDWFLPRLDDLCDTWPRIGDMADEIRALRSAMRSQLGLIAYDDDLKDGVVCPKCDSRAALHQANGSDRVECAVCGALLTLTEFDRWVGLLATHLVWLRGRHCQRCDLERLYRVKGHDEIRCGWCDLTQEDQQEAA